MFSKQVLDVLDPAISGASFSSVESILDILTNKIRDRKEKIVLVIDELPYWAEKDESLLSVFQKYIDSAWMDKDLMMILCGSALSFMEKKILSEKSPVFGRRDSQIRLEAFNYKEAALFVPGYSEEDKALCYGVTGGVAKYLSLFDAAKSLDENIISLFFRPDGYLFDETRNLLTQEFSDVTLVNNIIEQVASGVNTLNEIALKVHENATKVLYSLDKLIEIGLIERRTCITEEKNRKKTQYVLKDHMFKFWYRFVPKAVSVIELGQGDVYYGKIVKPQLHAYMGSVFEDMCRYYTLEHGVKGDYGVFITKTGCWWGVEQMTDDSGKQYRQSADIDVVGIAEAEKAAVTGECKFKNEKADKDTYDTLVRRSKLLSGSYINTKYLIFSLSGFSKWFDTADLADTILVSIKDMYE